MKTVWFALVVMWMAVGIGFAQQNGQGAGGGGVAPGLPAGLNAAGAGGAGVQPLQPPHDKAALIRLDAPVDDIMLQSIQRRLEIARKAGCTLVIYEMDTYGGMLTSALQIDQLTRKLPSEHMNVVAWVHDKAYSAGAFISVACQQVVMSHDSRIGDCAPIQVSMTGGINPLTGAERAKVVSPILADLDESAEQNHYDKALLHAMVVAEIEIHEVRNNVTGEVRYVDTKEKDRLLAQTVKGAGGGGAAGGGEHPWKFVRTVDDKSQLLTLNEENALKMGISKGTVNTEQDLRAALNIRGELLVLDYSWAERATAWLTQTWVRGMLFVAMLVFAWIEFSHPGVSVPGILAIACLLLLVGAPFLTGLAQIWEILLIVVGLGIIAADFFVFGGIGLLAVPGFLLMAVGLVASFVPAEPGGGWLPTMPSTYTALQSGLAVVIFGTIAAIGAFVLLSKYLYLTPGFRKLQLVPAGAGVGKVMSGSSATGAAVEGSDALFVGAIGKAATDLRPAGKARFDEQLADVVSNGGFIPRESEIEIVRIAGNKITVRALTGAASSV